MDELIARGDVCAEPSRTLGASAASGTLMPAAFGRIRPYRA